MSTDFKIVSPEHRIVWVGDKAKTDLIRRLATGRVRLPMAMRSTALPKDHFLHVPRDLVGFEEKLKSEPMVAKFEHLPQLSELDQLNRRIRGAPTRDEPWDQWPWGQLIQIIAICLRDPNHYVVFDDDDIDVYMADREPDEKKVRDARRRQDEARSKRDLPDPTHREGWLYRDLLADDALTDIDVHRGEAGMFLSVTRLDGPRKGSFRKLPPADMGRVAGIEFQTPKGLIVRVYLDGDGEVVVTEPTGDRQLLVLPWGANMIKLRGARNDE
jgi:hypothetical protein